MTERIENFRTWYKHQLRALPGKIWNRVKSWRLGPYDEQAIAFFAGLVSIFFSFTLLCGNNGDWGKPTIQSVLVSFFIGLFWFTVWCHGKYRREVKKK